MKVTLFCIEILSIACYISCYSDTNCTNKEVDEADLQTQKLYIAGSPDRKYPSNHNEMNTFCKESKDMRTSVKEFSTKCLVGIAKQVLGLMMYSVNKSNQNVCKSPKRRAEFTRNSGCGNAVKNETMKCWNKFVGEIDVIKDMENPKIRIPLCCCMFFHMKACNIRAYENEPKQCTKKATEGLDRLLDAYVTEPLRLLCSDYTDDSDKCDRITHLVPKLTNKKIPKSMTLPLLTLFKNLPEDTY